MSGIITFSGVARFACVFAAAITLVAALILPGNPAAADDDMVGDLKIEYPWTRATPPGAKVGGGYAKITNTGSEADRLVGGSAGFAGKVEIHEMSMNDGVMVMRPLADGIEIAPGETLELKPGGYHIMFMGLNAQIKEGVTQKATLIFEKAGSIEVDFAVAPIGAKQHGDMKDGAMKDGEMKHEGMDHSGHTESKS